MPEIVLTFNSISRSLRKEKGILFHYKIRVVQRVIRMVTTDLSNKSVFFALRI